MEWKGNLSFSLVASIALAVILAGCAEPNLDQGSASNGGKFYAVSTDATPFYRYGPQQGNGPDMKLQKDTLMTLIHPSFGYCKVKLMTGEQGYVASEDIRVAPAALVTAATAPPRPARSYRTPRLPPDSELILPPEALQEFNPEPTPIPSPPPGN
jgi:hypothetical protein